MFQGDHWAIDGYQGVGLVPKTAKGWPGSSAKYLLLQENSTYRTIMMIHALLATSLLQAGNWTTGEWLKDPPGARQAVTQFEHAFGLAGQGNQKRFSGLATKENRSLAETIEMAFLDPFAGPRDASRHQLTPQVRSVFERSKLRRIPQSQALSLYVAIALSVSELPFSDDTGRALAALEPGNCWVARARIMEVMRRNLNRGRLDDVAAVLVTKEGERLTGLLEKKHPGGWQGPHFEAFWREELGLRTELKRQSARLKAVLLRLLAHKQVPAWLKRYYQEMLDQLELHGRKIGG